MYDARAVQEHLIAIDPVEPDLAPGIIDERLAAGWFPWGQRWMTCRAWPMDDGPRDTIWVRVHLVRRPPSDRERRLRREGCSFGFKDGPLFDDEHQELYTRFRETRHPDWVESAPHLLLSASGEASPLLAHTREIEVRDPSGRLIAYRWFLQGRAAVAGLTSIYDTERDGLGTVARSLADQWAAAAGYAFSYPGYVWPGAEDPWYYKIKPGRTEWLDPEDRRWRPWDGDEPQPEALILAEIRRRLQALGEVVHYPGWAIPCVDPTSRGLASPYFVPGEGQDGELSVIIWNHTAERYEELRVVRHEEPSEGASGQAE